MHIFYNAQGAVKFKLIQVFMVVLVSGKNEEDPIKSEGTRAVITLSISFKMLKDS